MAEVELAWLENGPVRVARLVEELGLEGREVQLATRPGARHWHMKQPNQPGTLEVTWDPQRETFLLELRKGREGRWSPEMIRQIVLRLGTGQ